VRLEVFNSRVLYERSQDVVLITGDGRSLPGDLDCFLSWGIPHEVMAIGRSITKYPGNVQHWANVDGSDSKWWAEHLPLKNDGKMPIRHSLGDLPGYDIDWEIKDCAWVDDHVLWHGSSALFAVFISLALGFKKIVLAGCPLDSNGHWFFPEDIKGPRWTVESFMAWLDFAREPEAAKVRSLSGYTAQIVGEATREWASGI